MPFSTFCRLNNAKLRFGEILLGPAESVDEEPSLVCGSLAKVWRFTEVLRFADVWSFAEVWRFIEVSWFIETWLIARGFWISVIRWVAEVS